MVKNLFFSLGFYEAGTRMKRVVEIGGVGDISRVRHVGALEIVVSPLNFGSVGHIKLEVVVMVVADTVGHRSSLFFQIDGRNDFRHDVNGSLSVNVYINVEIVIDDDRGFAVLWSLLFGLSGHVDEIIN